MDLEQKRKKKKEEEKETVLERKILVQYADQACVYRGNC